jgi:hypothetical protein
MRFLIGVGLVQLIKALASFPTRTPAQRLKPINNLDRPPLGKPGAIIFIAARHCAWRPGMRLPNAEINARNNLAHDATSRFIDFLSTSQDGNWENAICSN